MPTFGDRRRKDAIGTVLVQQSLGYFIGTAEPSDLLTQEEDIGSRSISSRSASVSAWRYVITDNRYS